MFGKRFKEAKAKIIVEKIKKKEIVEWDCCTLYLIPTNMLQFTKSLEYLLEMYCINQADTWY